METPIVDIVLDELMRSAVDGGISSQRFEIIADTVGTLSSIRSRARIVSKLRKARLLSIPCLRPWLIDLGYRKNDAKTNKTAV